MRVIFATLGLKAELKDVQRFLDANPTIKAINKLPLVTVYTCAKNAAKWIQESMASVALQSNFQDYEYILIDDFSDDRTLYHMAKFCHNNLNARFIRNDRNIGLASSSNLALKNARGKFIIRIDADDFFIGKNVIDGMIAEIEKQDVDVIYPNCFAGLSKRTVQKGNENHHVGCALFRTSALNHIKFTDNLRNHDSLDIFLRAKDVLRLGYYNRTVFCYRQHNESMSRNNLKDREKTRKILESKYLAK
jgi:glycosyltransferase involved in cell wall biosynthesis